MNLKSIHLIKQDCEEALKATATSLSPLKGDTVVITGGTGFVGSWLTEMLATLNDSYAFGIKIHLLARSTDQFKLSKPHLASRKDISFTKADVRHTMELPKETNWLIHAGATPDGRFHASQPIETMTAISEGTATMLRAVDRCDAFKMFLNISSASIYGSQPSNLERLPESFLGAPDCASVSSAYAESKRHAETLCAAARSQARLPVATARPFAFIGPYQSLESPWAVNNFIRDALNGHPIRVLGDGKTVRSYMYPSDMAIWLLKILSSATSGVAYNVGSPEGVSLRDLANLVSKQFKTTPEIRLKAGGSMDTHPSRLVPDVSKAVEGLDLKLTVPLEEAIGRTVAWHRSLRDS